MAAAGAPPAGRRAPLSLKGRALALLAQREHSAAELRRKLLRHARAERASGAAADSDAPGRPGPGDAPGGPRPEDTYDERPGPDDAARVDALIEWLRAHRYFSEERFIESRIHARSARYGNLRIRQELAQHGVALPPEAADALRQSEVQRAAQVRHRKFGGAPADAAEAARQSRFLAQRGFSPETVVRVMREAARFAGDAEAPVDDD